LDPVSETGSLASPRDNMIEQSANTSALLSSVKALPKRGNSVQNLVQDLRTVLDSQNGVVDDTANMDLLSVNHSSSLNIATAIDSNKTTLGVVLTNDMVETVLPGAPAYLAGLRKGDRIVEVRKFVSTSSLVRWLPCHATEHGSLAGGGKARSCFSGQR
jgi:C-terminal processing protease CtpA/Prc